MNECDTLLMVGSGFPYSEFLPKAGTATGVQIDIDGRMLSLRYPMDVNLVGDSRETLRALRRCFVARRIVRGATGSRRTLPSGGRSSKRER